MKTCAAINHSGLTDRLSKLSRAILQTVVRQAGRPACDLPVLPTRLSPDQQEDLRTIHHRADWVVTVDRNAGVEFFDSPREEQAIYDAYVIDCVPERNDLGSLQMITSTTKTDEVRALLDEMLASMGLMRFTEISRAALAPVTRHEPGLAPRG